MEIYKIQNLNSYSKIEKVIDTIRDQSYFFFKCVVKLVDLLSRGFDDCSAKCFRNYLAKRYRL